MNDAGVVTLVGSTDDAHDNALAEYIDWFSYSRVHGEIGLSRNRGARNRALRPLKPGVHHLVAGEGTPPRSPAHSPPCPAVAPDGSDADPTVDLRRAIPSFIHDVIVNAAMARTT